MYEVSNHSRVILEVNVRSYAMKICSKWYLKTQNLIIFCNSYRYIIKIERIKYNLKFILQVKMSGKMS